MAPIPLIFVSKNLEPLKNLESTDYGSQEDLAPTLLALMGVPVPEEFMGRNLLQPTDHPYALGYFGGKLLLFRRLILCFHVGRANTGSGGKGRPGKLCDVQLCGAAS